MPLHYTSNAPSHTFGNLTVGDCFKFKDGVFIKVSTDMARVIKPLSSSCAVHFGDTTSFDFGAIVVHCNVTITID